MTAPATTRAADWHPAEGLTPRGTLVLLPGRGEHPGVYERFGRRLAADAYVVHVLDQVAEPDQQAVVAEIARLAAGGPAPLVLAGSDTGALRALIAAADPSLRVDAVLLVHGEADPVSPVAEARRLASELPRAVLATVADGRHDALNDISHRSVAATVVQWLERLRGGSQLPVVVTLSPADGR